MATNAEDLQIPRIIATALPELDYVIEMPATPEGEMNYSTSCASPMIASEHKHPGIL
jgi:hypothetical protein